MKEFKLNLGAGNKPLPKDEGWVNVDYNIDPAYAEDKQYDFMVDDVCTLQEVQEGTVDHILASHIIEHIHPSKVLRTLVRWRGVLKPSGTIRLEQPNIISCCINVLQSLNGAEENFVNQMGMWGIYGNSEKEGDFMNHMWGYSPVSLTSLLTDARFTDIEEVDPIIKPWGKDIRDFALIAKKGED